MKLSKDIEVFLNACKEAESQYNFNYEIVGKCNKKTTDYLHRLELDKLPSKERNKLTTAQKRNLKERREAKDIVEVTESLKIFIETVEGKKAINLLTQKLGEIRKVERYHANRRYNKRILVDD